MSIRTTAEMTVVIPLVVEDVEEDICDFTLACYAPLVDDAGVQHTTWLRINQEPAGVEYDLEIAADYSDGIWTVKTEDIKKGTGIRTKRREIRALFENALLESAFERLTDGVDGIEHEHSTTAEPPAKPDERPYDPKLIRVEPRQFAIDYVVKMIRDGDIDLSPDFQRRFVWSSMQKSRLIESLLLRIPLPVFYLSQDEDGRFKVVDGVQRLTVIRDFMDNRFRLRNLEYLTECNGKWFKSDSSSKESDALERLYVRRIEQTQLTFNIIDPQTPEQVKYDVFRRINTGGANLNRQEIRNCFENPETRAYIRDLAGCDEFLRATRESIKPTRMADDEIVLRFIAFYLWDKQLFDQRPYKGDMDSYLDETVELLNREIPRGCLNVEELPVELQKAQRRFKRAMTNAYVLFGEHAFRKSIFINKALFLSWSRALYRVKKSKLRDQVSLLPPDTMFHALQKELYENAEYNDALTKGTNDARNIKVSYDTAMRLLRENGVDI